MPGVSSGGRVVDLVASRRVHFEMLASVRSAGHIVSESATIVLKSMNGVP